MAATGYTPIQLYYSTTASAVPTAGNLASGELGINITDGKLYYKSNAGTVTLLASAAGASGDVVGPSSATDNALARFDTTTGKLIQNSVGILSDAGVLTGLTGLTSSGSITFSGLTPNRLVYPTTGGALVGSADLTFDGSRLISTVGKFGTGAAANSASLMVNNPANTATGIQIFQDSIDSWIMGMSANSGVLRWSASSVEQMSLSTSGLVIGRVVSGGMSAQTGLTVIGGTSVSDGTPGALTLGSHLNSRTTGDQIGKIDFYSNDASGGSSGVQASIRGVTQTAIGDAAGLIFYTGTSSSLSTAGGVNYAQQWGLGSSNTDGNFRLTLWGAAGDNNGLSIYETSTGGNARLRINQGSGVVYYNATYSSGGNYHSFQIGNGTVAAIDSSGVNAVAGSTAFLTGSLGSRLWTPGLAIGTGTYAGLYGPALTYLADKSGSTWVSNGGGTAGALTIDEGYFSFARSNGVGSAGVALTWTTYLNSDASGNFFFNSTGVTKVASGNTAARPTATAGGLRWNTTFPQLEVGNGTTFNKIVTENLITSATGGTITTDGDYKVHTFTSSGTFTVSAISGTAPVEVEVLLVGGGGGGGYYLGGGGGSGAMLETVAKVTGASYTVTVGAGGASVDSGFTYSGNGAASSISGGLVSLAAYGGGAGGNGYLNDAWGANGSANRDIGSGGGGGSPYGTTTVNNGITALSAGGPAGWNGSGGAWGTMYGGGTTFNGGGGGGGALGAGVAPNVGNGPVGGPGYGGNGRPSSITGSLVTYAGGGGGGYGTYTSGQTDGGSGGGGAGAGSGDPFTTSATAGSTNLGGGGGGGQLYTGYRRGGAGGSGVVIIRYKFQ